MTLLKSKLLITSLLTLTLAACSGSESKEDNTRIDEDGNTIITVNDKDITAANINKLLANRDDLAFHQGQYKALDISMDCNNALDLEGVSMAGCFKIDECGTDGNTSYAIVMNMKKNNMSNGNLFTMFRLNYATPDCKGDYTLDTKMAATLPVTLNTVDTNTYVYRVTFGYYYYDALTERSSENSPGRSELLVDPTTSQKALCLGNDMLNIEEPMYFNPRLAYQELDSSNCAVAFD